MPGTAGGRCRSTAINELALSETLPCKRHLEAFSLTPAA